MTAAFIATTDGYTAPVTLIARDVDEAFRFFHLWRNMHAPHLGDADAFVAELSERDLADQPQLAAVMETGRVGVAWWTGDQAGWVVGTPDGDALGELVRPTPSVRCFVFDGTIDYGTLYVFAEDLDQAVATLHAYSQDQNGWDADYESVAEMSPWLLTGVKVTLRAEMFEGKTGVGMECEDGWHILPADYDPPLPKRDGSER